MHSVGENFNDVTIIHTRNYEDRPYPSLLTGIDINKLLPELGLSNIIRVIYKLSLQYETFALQDILRYARCQSNAQQIIKDIMVHAALYLNLKTYYNLFYTVKTYGIITPTEFRRLIVREVLPKAAKNKELFLWLLDRIPVGRHRLKVINAVARVANKDLLEAIIEKYQLNRPAVVAYVNTLCHTNQMDLMYPFWPFPLGPIKHFGELLSASRGALMWERNGLEFLSDQDMHDVGPMVEALRVAQEYYFHQPDILTNMFKDILEAMKVTSSQLSLPTKIAIQVIAVVIHTETEEIIELIRPLYAGYSAHFVEYAASTRNQRVMDLISKF
ncbi:hypothetical protein AKO1_004009 [Acrasis kona]|uniref:Uncharacterized protein n=1 Tax=Acrasis kona TaxID=1008807 RepID=A0AAW2ZPY7_9EUKA